MVSADMAHALHPNHASKHDKGYAVTMGGGPVLKSHGQKHYATDAHSEALLRNLAGNSGIPVQKFIFRSDLPCGSSLGPLASTWASIRTVDVGNPLWAMHSSREVASISDHAGMTDLIRELWKS